MYKPASRCSLRLLCPGVDPRACARPPRLHFFHPSPHWSARVQHLRMLRRPCHVDDHPTLGASRNLARARRSIGTGAARPRPQAKHCVSALMHTYTYLRSGAESAGHLRPGAPRGSSLLMSRPRARLAATDAPLQKAGATPRPCPPTAAGRHASAPRPVPGCASSAVTAPQWHPTRWHLPQPCAAPRVPAGVAGSCRSCCRPMEWGSSSMVTPRWSAARSAAPGPQRSAGGAPR